MTDGDGENERSLEDFMGDDPYEMDTIDQSFNSKKRATEKSEDTDIIVQHPVKAEVPDDIEADSEYIETMGLSVSAPNDSVVTVQNTSSDSLGTSRFVAFDPELIDELIRALAEAKVRHDGEPPETVRAEGKTEEEVTRIVERALAEANRSIRTGCGCE